MSNKNLLWTGVHLFLGACELAMLIVYYKIVSRAIFIPEIDAPLALKVEIALVAVFLTADSALSGSLIFLLYRKRSGMKRTDSVIRLIIIYTVSSTAITGMSVVWAKSLANHLACISYLSLLACGRHFLPR